MIVTLCIPTPTFNAILIMLELLFQVKLCGRAPPVIADVTVPSSTPKQVGGIVTERFASNSFGELRTILLILSQPLLSNVRIWKFPELKPV